MNRRPLPDIPPYSVDISPSDDPYAEFESFRIYGRDNHKFFEAFYSFSRGRLAGDQSSGFRFDWEHNLLYLAEVDATEGHGLGSLVTNLAIQEALKRDIHLGRTGLTNPKMVNVIENLVSLAIINSALYRATDGVRAEEPKSTEFAAIPGLINAAQAREWIDHNDLAYVDCVITF